MTDETGAECDDIVEGPGLPDTPQKAAEGVPDCVCPLCFKPMANASMMALPDRYGRKIRKYFGFCPACRLGSRSIQFERDGRWIIHQYQIYDYVSEFSHSPPKGKSVTLNDLPEPAPIVTGPGGEYDKQITLTKQNVMLLSTLRRGLESFSVALECFMRHFGLKE